MIRHVAEDLAVLVALTLATSTILLICILTLHQ